MATQRTAEAQFLSYLMQGISPFAEIKQWIEDDLKRSLSDVMSWDLYVNPTKGTGAFTVVFPDGTQKKVFYLRTQAQPGAKS